MGEIDEIISMKKELKKDTKLFSGEEFIYPFFISMALLITIWASFYLIPIEAYIFSLGLIGICIVFVGRVWSIASREKNKAEKEIGEDGWKVLNKYD